MSVLVISGGMYNDQPSVRTVLGMPVITEDPGDSWVAALGEGQFAVIDHVRPYPKRDFEACRRGIDIDALTETNNLLFKLLATD